MGTSSMNAWFLRDLHGALSTVLWSDTLEADLGSLYNGLWPTQSREKNGKGINVFMLLFVFQLLDGMDTAQKW